MTLLLLWDIDGTLLQRASTEHAEALRRALREVHGDELSLEDVRVPAAGRTDGAIARDILLACGVDAAAIDAEVEAVAQACCRAFGELCPPDLSERVAPGIADLLPALAADTERYRFSLVTGNFEPVARLKLDRAGIGSFFPDGQGGFGTDAEDRLELPPIARARAGGWPRERTVVIGDTPNDIACARADGIPVIGIATGPYGADDLREADHVAEHAADLPALLEQLA